MSFYDELSKLSAATPEQIQDAMQAWALRVFVRLGVPTGKFEPKNQSLSYDHQLNSGEKPAGDLFHQSPVILGDGYWRCVYVITLNNGRKTEVDMRLITRVQPGLPVGSVQFAGVACKPGDDLPIDAIQEALTRAMTKAT